MQMNELTCQQAKFVEQFRERMKNEVPADWYKDILLFYRFLKARNFDVDEAEKMLRKHLHWRKLYQVDTILKEFKPRAFFHKYVEPAIIGFDKEGDLVMFLAAGKMEHRELLKCEKLNTYKRYFIWMGEKVVQYVINHNIKNGCDCRQFIFIIDLDKLTLSNVLYPPTIDILLCLTNLFQDNYPEIQKAVYVINAPSYYVYAFSVMKAVMSNATIQKYRIFSRSGWKEELLKVIDADLLPAFLGGNRTDPDGDPLCRTFIRHGGIFSPEYYLPDEERYFKDKSRVTTIVVPSSKKEEICVDVEEPGRLIVWEFFSKSRIHFGLFYEVSEQDLEEVIPLEEYHTVDGTEKYFHRARKAGKYIIVFDNTSSWLNSKEVEYCIDVV